MKPYLHIVMFSLSTQNHSPTVQPVSSCLIKTDLGSIDYELMFLFLFQWQQGMDIASPFLEALNSELWVLVSPPKFSALPQGKRKEKGFGELTGLIPFLNPSLRESHLASVSVLPHRILWTRIRTYSWYICQIILEIYPTPLLLLPYPFIPGEKISRRLSHPLTEALSQASFCLWFFHLLITKLSTDKHNQCCHWTSMWRSAQC